MVAHPSVFVLSASFSRTDLFTVVYCLVDDWMKQRFGSSNEPRRRGPAPTNFSDAELLTVLLVGELCQLKRERAWLRQVRASYLALFPGLLEESRFARRAEQVRELLRALRQAVLFWADADLEPLRVLDTFPMPLCACYRIRQSELPLREGTFGRNASKRLWYYGLRPAVLMTASGFLLDVILAPGNCSDPRLLANYLDECVEQGRDLQGQVWVMDKGFRGRAIVAWAAQRLGLTLLPRQHDRGGERPSYWQQTLDRLRKPVEGLIANLTESCGIEHLLVRTGIGVYRRTQAKATAFALAGYFNRVLGLEIAHVARYAV